MNVVAAIEELKRTLVIERNPLLVANELSFIISDLLRDSNASLYEAFVLNSEQLRLTRMSYLVPAFRGRVRISTCLSLLNQKLLADVLSENSVSELMCEWCFEAYDRNQEKRQHYILDRFAEFVVANRNPDLLLVLKRVRTDYHQLSDDRGPYHVECFPYHFFSPEELLLGELSPPVIDRSLGLIIEDLLLALSGYE